MANLKSLKSIKAADMGINQPPSLNSATFKSLAAEFIATFTFLFLAMAAGCTLIAKEQSETVLGGVAVAFAAVAVIYSFGGLSGAHFNPAVTFGSVIGLRMNIFKGMMYIAVQLMAAFAATGVLVWLYPNRPDLLSKLTLQPPADGGYARAVVIEMIMSFFLVMTIYATALGKAPTVRERTEMAHQLEEDEKAAVLKHHEEGGVMSKEAELTLEHTEEPAEAGTYDPNKPFAGLAIGLMLGTLCYVGGEVSGGAFNPARATAPAVLSGVVKPLWVYWVGDFVGAAAAAIVYNLILQA